MYVYSVCGRNGTYEVRMYVCGAVCVYVFVWFVYMCVCKCMYVLSS
jgi:hypothetical protein